VEAAALAAASTAQHGKLAGRLDKKRKAQEARQAEERAQLLEQQAAAAKAAEVSYAIDSHAVCMCSH
jgi:hypothetical protein